MADTLAPAMRPITLLTDYGHDDEFAGVCRAVIERIAPGATVIDLTHGISRGAVAEGSVVLARSLPYAPPGVHVAVVDPGVGTERRGVAVRVAQEDRILVGPDNGLLAPAVEALGGAVEAADISRSPLSLEPVAATFDGRDVFCPVAAHIVLGTHVASAGHEIDPATLAPPLLKRPQVVPSGVLAHVAAIDGFGNVSLDVTHGQVADAGLRVGRRAEIVLGEESHRAPFGTTFSDVAAGELVVYEDAYRSLAIAVNMGSAAEELGLEVGTELTLRPA